jgi:hypothetical protein
MSNQHRRAPNQPAHLGDKRMSLDDKINARPYVRLGEAMGETLWGLLSDKTRSFDLTKIFVITKIDGVARVT